MSAIAKSANASWMSCWRNSTSAACARHRQSRSQVANVADWKIARALATDPAFMLLDEPFAGVDPISVSDIQNLVRHLTARGIGVLITDHNVRENARSHRSCLTSSMRASFDPWTCEDIVNNADVRRLYLGDKFSL